MTTIDAVLSMVFERIDRKWPQLKFQSYELRELLLLLRRPQTNFIEYAVWDTNTSNGEDTKMTAFAYMIENCLEYLEVVREAAAGVRKSRSLPSCLWKFPTLRHLKNLTELTNDKDLLERIGVLYEKYLSWEGSKPVILSNRIVNQLTPTQDTNMIGMEQFVNTLNNQINPPRGAARMVISGMLGSGKSTVACQLFLLNRDKFDYCVWVTVSHAVEKSNIVRTIASDLLRHLPRGDVMGFGTEELLKHIDVITSTRKCLIVLDDVWSSTTDGDFWNNLKDYMSQASFIITTQEKWVPNSFINHDYVYQVPRLTMDESEKLFLQKSGQRQISENTPEVLDRCNGLPLAIVEAASYKPISSYALGLSASEKTILDVVYPSYACLPNLKRLCLLYFGLFPLGQQIPLEKLFLLWMAEGMVVNRDEAEEYLNDFVHRNLVLVQEEDGVRSCRPHDPVRTFCCLIGRIDKFLSGYEQVDRKTFYGHRYSMFLKGKTLKDILLPDSINFLHYRSFLISGTVKTEISELINDSRYQVVDDLQRFKWMRTLDFNAIDFKVGGNKYFPQGIDELVYLRYLGFRNCYLDELSLSFSNFPFLETLDLRVRDSSGRMIIPYAIGKLLKLRHLYFPAAYQSPDEQKKLKLNDLKLLEVLENFHPGVCDADDLMEMRNLKTYTVTADGACTPDLYKLVPVIHGNNQQHLPMSSLTLVDYHCVSDHRIDLLTKLLACDSLTALHLGGPIERIPPISANLTKIVFDGCEFTEDPMPELGGLLHLSVLVLCNDAIDVNKICCLRSSFKELTSLKMSNLQSLEKWDVRGGAMSKLSVLTIERCPRLQALPDELVTISSLKKLEMGIMPKQLQDNVLKTISDRRSQGKA